MEQLLEVSVAIGEDALPGFLGVPFEAGGVVVFAHGSGSSRFSTRNQAVATQLRHANLATLLTDLLTERESRDRANVFDIGLISERLVSITEWLRAHHDVGELPIGYFGASTGAAAAIRAAVALEGEVAAVVSRGGRPDLAHPDERLLRAPTLLIVGSADEIVLDLNRRAYSEMSCTKELAVVPGATHLFAEPGALEAVADLAAMWFKDHLIGPDPAA